MARTRTTQAVQRTHVTTGGKGPMKQTSAMSQIQHPASGGKRPAKTTLAIHRKAAMKTTPAEDVIKPKRRFRAGTVARREIRKQQKSVNLLIHRAPFGVLVKKLLLDMAPITPHFACSDVRIERAAMEALQVATEDHMIRALERAKTLATHGKRITVQDKDFNLAIRIVDVLHRPTI